MTPENKKRKGGVRLEKTSQPNAETPRKKPERPTRTRDQIVRRRVIILAVAAAALLMMALALKAWIREPDIPIPPLPSGEVVEPGSGLEYTSDRKQGVYTFLLLGRDTGGGGNTDTMMVASYDTKNQTVNVLNVYRDTMVNAPWDIKRINSVYNVAGGGEKGIESLKEYLSKLIGFAPDFYITVEWDAVGQLVEAIGGVEFDVPYEMHYYDPTQNLRINVSKGLQTLNGDKAMQVIRWRKNNDGSKTSVGDIGRVEIQQDFLRAVISKCLKTINVGTVPKFAQILLNNVTTDIPLGTIVWFGQKAMGLDMENLGFHSLPGNLNGAAWSRSYGNYQSYVLPDGPAILELINASFNPYQDDVQLSDLDIMSVNKNGSLSSTGGTVRDKAAAQAPVIPSKAPVEPDDETDVGTGESAPPEPSASPGESPNPSASPQPSEDIPPEFQTPEPSAGVPGPSPSTSPGDSSPSPTPTPPPSPAGSAEPTPPPTLPPTAAPAPTADIPPEFLPAVPTPVS